jgi:hypothetical protein
MFLKNINLVEIRYLLFVSFYGFIVFVILDVIEYFDKKYLLKYFIAIVANVIYGFIDLNNNNVDKNQLEFIIYGHIENYIPKDKSFQFLGTMNYVIIFIYTTIIIILFIGIKYGLKKLYLWKTYDSK